jgi:hypothetical protein
MAAAKGSRAGRDFTLLGCFLEAAVSISISKSPPKWRLFGLLISRGLAFGPSFDQ